MDNHRRSIEESFPVKEANIESAREKNIRHEPTAKPFCPIREIRAIRGQE
jgi:adenine-specific DNA methylase